MITFLLTRWRIILPIIIISVMSLSILYYKTRYASIVSELELFKANIATETVKREAENAALAKYAKQAVESVTLHHTQQLEELKNVYEKRNKTYVGTIADMRNKLRDKIASDSAGVPETASDTKTTAEEWRNRYSTIAGQYQTLKDACVITTIDYDALRDYADKNCELFGCE